MIIDNPRYPHRVIITRSETDNNGTPITDDNGNPLFTTVVDSECGLRNITEADVNMGIAQSDIKISLPQPEVISVWKVKVTDSVRFTNSQTGEVTEGKVTKYRPNNIGMIS